MTNDQKDEALSSQTEDDISQIFESARVRRRKVHTILFFDDLQWFDLSSIKLVQYMVSSATKQVHLVATIRERTKLPSHFGALFRPQFFGFQHSSEARFDNVKDGKG